MAQDGALASHQRGEPVEQFERGEGELGLAGGQRLGEAIAAGVGGRSVQRRSGCEAPERCRRPSRDAVHGKPEGAYVLEVGIINYELISDQLILQVAMKLMRPQDGRIVGHSPKNAWLR